MSEKTVERIEDIIAGALEALGNQQSVLAFLLDHFNREENSNDSFAIALILSGVIQQLTDLSGELDHFSALVSRERRGTAK